MRRTSKAGKGGCVGAEMGRAVQGQDPAWAKAGRQKRKAWRERSTWYSLWSIGEGPFWDIRLEESRVSV